MTHRTGENFAVLSRHKINRLTNQEGLLVGSRNSAAMQFHQAASDMQQRHPNWLWRRLTLGADEGLTLPVLLGRQHFSALILVIILVSAWVITFGIREIQSRSATL